MQSLSGDEQRRVLGEVLADQLQAILEYVQEIPAIKEHLESIENRLTKIEGTLNIHEADIR